MIGAFCFEDTWKGWSPERMASELAGIRTMGLDVIVTETVDPPVDLIDAAREAGLRAFVSVPCFSAHSRPELIEGLDVHPVQADRRPRRQMEWYTGIVPTHGDYNQGLLERIREVASARPDALLLDFIRWPLHWELELRAGAPEPQESSFDAHSISAFSIWLRERGLEHEGDLEPAVLTGPLRDRWTEFKCDVISGIACRAAEVVRSTDAAISVGAFIVPGTDEQRRRLLGQDVASLGACLDLLLPMTYHGILHRPIDLVAEATTDLQERSASTVIPVVQVTAEEAVAGPWDWGPEVTPDDVGQAVEAALKVTSGVVLFPLEGLDAPRREVLSGVLATRFR